MAAAGEDDEGDGWCVLRLARIRGCVWKGTESGMDTFFSFLRFSTLLGRKPFYLLVLIFVFAR